MGENVEDILKEIHVLFAKSKSFGESTDLKVVSQEDMFGLLDRLNVALNTVLEKYEATTLSRERARIDMEREHAEAVAAAKRDCDDVHASALLYTDKMLESINDVFEKTKYKLKTDLLEAIAQLEDQTEIVAQFREGVKNDLTEMHDNELYLKVLEDERKKAEEKRMYGLMTPEEARELAVAEEANKPAAAKLDIRINNPGENSGVTLSTRSSHKSGKKKPQSQSQTPAEHEEGTPYSADEFDLDKEYFEFKEEQEGTGEETKPKKKGLFGWK